MQTYWANVRTAAGGFIKVTIQAPNPVRCNGNVESDVWGQAHVGLRISHRLTIIPSRSRRHRDHSERAKL